MRGKSGSLLALAGAILVILSPTSAMPFGLSELGWGPVVLTPSFKMGYQTMGLNINLPIPPGPPRGPSPPLFGLDSLDASVKRTNLWVGSSRLAVQLGDGYVFAGAEGALPKQVTALFDQHPMVQYAGLSAPIHMKGSKFRWWMWEVGAGYTAYDRLIIFVALRRDQLSVGLSQPTLEGGVPLVPNANVADFIGADLLTRLWVPYLGLNFSGPRFSTSLAWSPLATIEVKLPFRNIDEINARGETASYFVNKPGNFVEAKFDADMRIMQTFDLGVWVKGTWLQVRGIGTEDFRPKRDVPVSAIDEAASATAEAVISRYQVSGGLTGAVAF